MPKFTYDPEVKILSIQMRGGKSVDSDIKDNVVLDYDQKGHIVNIDIMEVNLEDLMKNSVKAKIQKRRLVKVK